MTNWIETHEEFLARRKLEHVKRRQAWRRQARENKPATLLRAKNLARQGLGWENIALLTGLPGQMCRRLVIRKSHALGVRS